MSLRLNNYHLKGNIIRVYLSQPPSEGDKDAYTVYVSNLPFSIDEQKLRDHFNSVLSDPTLIDEVRLIRDPKTNKVKGFAYVQLKERRLVSYVCDTLNKSKIDGRTISVEKSQSNLKESQLGYTAHVNNLSFKVTEEELRETFENLFGQVKKVHLVKKEDGSSKGYAFVEFVDAKGLAEAVKKKELILQERTAIIKRSTRSITEEKKTDDQVKKRETKRDRKKLIADLIDDAINEVSEPAKQEEV